MAEDPAHPRTVFELIGHEREEGEFDLARTRGRLHHAWLLCGTEGVGKATFAYRAARRLLGARPSQAHGLLGSDPSDPVCRQIIARSHPDLLVLEREGPDGKPRKVIPVDEARTLGEFFSKSPAVADFRVAIIDAADDLNVNAANAVLKTLEEPPARGVLFLVSHVPGRLLPTIRSRCRKLQFQSLEPEVVASFLRARIDVNPEEALRLATMAHGAPGRALGLASTRAIEIDDTARDLLATLPFYDESQALALADRMKGPDGQAHFNLLIERLTERIHAQTVDRAAVSAGSLDRWAAAWEMLQRLPREVEAVNLDRADALFTALQELRAAARD